MLSSRELSRKSSSCGPFGDLKERLGYDVLAKSYVNFHSQNFTAMLITLAYNQIRFIVCIAEYKYDSTLRTEMQKEVNQLFIGRQYYKQKSI